MRRLTQAERTDLSDRRMLEAAIRLIVERGISRTKLTDVGVQAGYSRGLAAMRFGTKAELLSRVVHFTLSNWISRAQRTVGSKTGLAAVYAAIDAQDLWSRESPSEMRALYGVFFQSTDPGADYRANVARTLSAQRRELANWIREARDAGDLPASTHPEREGRQILCAMLGIVYQWIMDPSLDAHAMHSALQQDLAALYSMPGAEPDIGRIDSNTGSAPRRIRGKPPKRRTRVNADTA
jgi:AcrR family transcriptional regulator